MFTGIVEEVGIVEVCLKGSSSLKLRIAAEKVLEGSKVGDSICVNGACLTITELSSSSFEADVSYETIRSSTLSALHKASRVNLERAAQISSRLGGHIVLGHVDSKSQVLSISNINGFYSIKLSFDSQVERYIVHKGSVAIDGISLTVAEVEGSSFSVAVIPHTFNSTTLKYLKTGDFINLETDILARYVENLLKNDKKSDRLESLLSSFS